ncbi:I78 family peptidase inhibitor [Acinetobacter sp. TSRC1-2]|uniref:I78 family peptidase inhibitor n=1 Tax=unclassified Acinetobacter TaxID=196816 RepID=UPI003CF8467A
MKKILLLGFMISSLAACSTVHNTDTTAAKLGAANPASEYCINQGGKLEIKNETNGQVGYCHLPNSQVIEEWKYFQDSSKECLAEEAKVLVGQTGLTDAQIKQKTQSEIIRRVAPGQPVTMDYRANRITVTIDPVTKKIAQASCG